MKGSLQGSRGRRHRGREERKEKAEMERGEGEIRKDDRERNTGFGNPYKSYQSPMFHGGCCLRWLWSCSLTTLGLSFPTFGKTDTICITNTWSHGKGHPGLLPLSSFVKDSFTFKNLIHHFKCFIHISILQFPLWLKEGLVLYSVLKGEQKSEPPTSPTAAATYGAASSESGRCSSCSGITYTLIRTPWAGLRPMLQKDSPWSNCKCPHWVQKKRKEKTA